MPSTDPLDRTRAARPCNSSWDLMTGDGRKRRCSNCCQDVYNVQGLARSEAIALIAANEGSSGSRLYRRADGTLLTSNCSGSRAAVRRSRLKIAAVAAAAALCIVGLGAMANAGDEPETYCQIPVPSVAGQLQVEPDVGAVEVGLVDLDSDGVAPDHE